MKNLKYHLTFILLVKILTMQSISYSQNECPISEWYPNFSAPAGFIGGLYKPQRTDSAEGIATPLDASFKVLIIFVQFPDEDPVSNTTEWPIGDPPTYWDKLLSSEKRNTGPFWNRYNETTERLSDYYQEVSRGQMHMTGVTRHYIFDHPRSWYNNNPTLMNNEVYTKLQADINISWRDYDTWQRLSEGNYRYQGEGNVDYLTIVRRTNPGYAGFAGLDGSDFEIDPLNHIFIRTGFDQFGSGSVIQGNQNNATTPPSYNRFYGILIHELGHYLWGLHSTVGILTSRGGNSINDLFYSPFEKIKLGYINPKVFDYYQFGTNYTLSDISCRNSSNEVLKVPISSNEYFLIENRRKISKYDVKMLGDTTRLDMLTEFNNYGKGVYIYHHLSTDLQYPGGQDEECADGIWNWGVDGTAIPDWTLTGTLPLLKRLTLPSTVNNDDGYWGNLNNKDGISANYFGGDGVYFSLGRMHTSAGLRGTDKIYTNTPDYWTSRELWGDRLDAWNPGYNEIFSPYSNPSTKKWDNTHSNIFIYHHALNNEIANFKIYKVGEPFSETEILTLTPPSRPMGIKLEEYYPPNTSVCRPKIVWSHNSEPDMVRFNEYKKYKIYKATQPSMSLYPINYILLATVDIPVTEIPSYIDYSVYKYDCSLFDRRPPYGTPFPLRYYVKAVDMYDYESVPSDFVQTIGITSGIEETGLDHFSLDPEIPNEYSLKQNYPNPFNPTTNIKYDLPFDNFVTIKVFSILGTEIMTLVNEFINAGSYNVSFNGSNLPSGIYYYKINAGSFEEIRKMILLK